VKHKYYKGNSEINTSFKLLSVLSSMGRGFTILEDEKYPFAHDICALKTTFTLH
jgi:hypothetical protein